jgi:hypothetical protein
MHSAGASNLHRSFAANCGAQDDNKCLRSPTLRNVLTLAVAQRSPAPEDQPRQNRKYRHTHNDYDQKLNDCTLKSKSKNSTNEFSH